jgi:hypothetical protein
MEISIDLYVALVGSIFVGVAARNLYRKIYVPKSMFRKELKYVEIRSWESKRMSGNRERLS